jgi:HlyD family secretion protein
MKRKTWITASASIVLLALALAWAFAPRPVEVEVAQATPGRFEVGIDEDGKTRLRERYVVSAPLAGRLSRITLREGDPVEAGAVLATLTPLLSPMLDERSVREQQARVEAAQALQQRATTRIERAKVGLEQARNEVRRTEQLAAQGFVAPTKAEGDRLTALGAQKELDAAVEDQHIATHELEQARAALGVVRRGTGAAASAGAARGFGVSAPAAGRVLRVLQSSEAMVALGTPLLELGDTARMEIVAELLTTDALQAKPGSRVRIERWGGPEALEGQVRRVEPAAFTKVSALGVEEQRVNVLIDITSPPQTWRALGDGFRVGLRIITLSVEQALRVPVSAVFPLPQDADPSGASGATLAVPMAVFVIEGGRARQVPVVIGARNAGVAWVTQGLQPGTPVIVYPGTALREGVRVRQRSV